ncbi:MAG: DUF418 domain-containing protein [Bacillota bacterium]
MDPPARPAPTPTPEGERIAIIDTLRGFALFGILLVNMRVFSTPWIDPEASALLFPGPLDRAVDWSVRFLAEGKFYTLFAFLFGLGIWLQGERGHDTRLLRRRLLFLLLLGLLHALFIWSGDILAPYALLGLLLLLFRRRSTRTIIIWMMILLAIPLGLSSWLNSLADGEPGGLSAMASWMLELYRHGTYGEIVGFRLLELGLSYVAMAATFGLYQVLTLFLAGLLAGRFSLFREPERHRALLRRVLFWGLPLGAAGSLLALLSDSLPLLTLGALLGGPGLGFAYGAGLTLLSLRPGWTERLAPLTAAGRMAFTNYLLQSVICTLIFYSYGLGLYGQVGPAAGLILSFLIYSLQLLLSRWWLARFRSGPLEWLWRSLTYRRLLPLRR